MGGQDSTNIPSKRWTSDRSYEVGNNPPLVFSHHAGGRFSSQHWLIFSKGRVAGCGCGFEADLDEDCGYGDSVVNHMAAVSGYAFFADSNARALAAFDGLRGRVEARLGRWEEQIGEWYDDSETGSTPEGRDGYDRGVTHLIAAIREVLRLDTGDQP